MLARGRLGVAVRVEIGGRERFRVSEVSVERQHQRGTLLYQAHSGMGMPVDAAFVTFGLPKPALQIEVVLGEIQKVSSGKEARRETPHHPTHVLAEGILIPQKPVPDPVELRPALFRGTVFRI